MKVEGWEVGKGLMGGKRPGPAGPWELKEKELAFNLREQRNHPRVLSRFAF